MMPSDLPALFLEQITQRFSVEHKVGSGGYGEVYKGVLNNGTEIAVKKLYDVQDLDDKQFKNEFSNLMKVQHKNIIRFIGYCNEARHVPFVLNGEHIFAKRIYKVLCFEYLPRGSLDKHLYEESSGLDWCTRYQIIKGICEGLNYLHNGLEEPIFHLDLKPANVLLDKNMEPKIADFGVSRPCGGTHTHTTKVCVGSEYYMAPEYLSKRQISNKNDIFSLGIIIIQIMAGPMGYAKFAEMPSAQQFMDLARIAKIGLWGGAGGSNHQDIDDVEPHHLERLIIFSGEVIYSLEFSYRDHNGQQHTAGPWGGDGPNKGSKRNEIQLDLSEYIIEVSGTIGPFVMAPAGVITSLSFITNARSYGPFGEVRGTPFQIPVQGNGSIVGFFVRAGWYLDAFGVYVKPKQETIEDEEKATLAMIGPWGGNGGSPCDLKVAPHRLDSMTICSDVVINSLEISYSEYDGQKHTIGPWGAHGGANCTIEFGPSEFLVGIYGTTGPFREVPAADIVTSLTLVTNERRCGPFGQVGGTPFQIPMRGNGGIVGFFGRADSFIHAIGVYANPRHEEMDYEANKLGKSGPWGGRGGQDHFIDDEIGPEPHRLVSMTICFSDVINSIEFSYIGPAGNEHTVGPWSGPGGTSYRIQLSPLELLQGISGTFGPSDAASPNNIVITSLTFATNQCLGYGPLGQGGGTPFTTPAETDGYIVGFFARAGSYLNALGAYTRTDVEL